MRYNYNVTELYINNLRLFFTTVVLVGVPPTRIYILDETHLGRVISQLNLKTDASTKLHHLK